MKINRVNVDLMFVFKWQVSAIRWRCGLKLHFKLLPFSLNPTDGQLKRPISSQASCVVVQP